MSHPDTVALTADHGLGTVRTMPQFRTHIEQGPLSDAQRRLVLDQAEILIEEIYVHLPLKRAMHAVDPLQALRLLRHRLAELTETEFHVQLQRIFLGLHDLHTNYILPSRFAGFAFLGVFLERCVDNGRTAYVVTKTFDHITGDPQLKAGVEVTHWNGTPIHLAVVANAAREAGSNKAAQLTQGLQNMTLRAINMSLPPDEDWVDITYKVDGATHETRVPWRVFESGAEVTAPGDPALPALRRPGRGAPPGRHGPPHRADPPGEASVVRPGLDEAGEAPEGRQGREGREGRQGQRPQGRRRRAARGRARPDQPPRRDQGADRGHPERHVRAPADLHLPHAGPGRRGVRQRGRPACSPCCRRRAWCSTSAATAAAT